MSRPSDQDLDVSVAMLLRVGVTLAAIVAILGGIFLGGQVLNKLPDYSHFQPSDPGLRSIPGIVEGALHFSPRSVIQLGLLILIATPVARVILCVIGFARQRNRFYTAVSAIVLAILIFSFVKAGR